MAQRKCPQCGADVPVVSGIERHAAARERAEQGFDPTHFARLHALEAAHFWFRARNRLIIWALARHHPTTRRHLEVGCGTGFVLGGVAHAFPQTELWGSELFAAGLPFAATRAPAARLLQMDACDIPFTAAFDTLGAFDVLEHIADDSLALRQMHAALRPGGTLVLTVPQHPWLWSAADEQAHHQRRYTARDLHQCVSAAGFQILRSTSFVTLLLPAMAWSRWRQRRVRSSAQSPDAELALPTAINQLFERMLNAEQVLIRRGFDLPAGGSRLLVARKSPTLPSTQTPPHHEARHAHSLQPAAHDRQGALPHRRGPFSGCLVR